MQPSEPQSLDVLRQALGEPPGSCSRADRVTHICNWRRIQVPGGHLQLAPLALGLGAPAAPWANRPEFQSPARGNLAPRTLPGHSSGSSRPAQPSQAAAGRAPAAPSSPSRPWATSSAPGASPWGLAPSRPRASFFVSELALKVM